MTSAFDLYPQLRDSWDTAANGEMSLWKGKASDKPRWVCSKVICHRWIATISDRVRGQGCGICGGKQVCADYCNSIWTTKPSLRAQWDEAVNGDMKTYTSGSSKIVAWKCEQVPHHRWTASISNRAKSSGQCVICTGKQTCMVDGCNSLWAAAPHLRAEWHPDNPDMKTLAPHSRIVVKWICPKNPHHIWSGQPTKRVSAEKACCSICSHHSICQADFCNSAHVLASQQIRDEWDTALNGDMRQFSLSSNKSCSWVCSQNSHHKWRTALNHRTGVNPTGCPICSRSTVCVVDFCTSLSKTHPEFAPEWDEVSNGSMDNYLSGSNESVRWVCLRDNHHRWSTMIANRTGANPTGCPICNRVTICPVDFCTSLPTTHPQLASEWDSVSNGSMNNYLSGSDKIVCWVCPQDNHHRWDARIANRTGDNPRGCPVCSHCTTCLVDFCTSLSTTHPQLASEWDETNNGSMNNYLPQSNKSVSWVCRKDCHHRWHSAVSSRTRKVNPSGCPICSRCSICAVDFCTSFSKTHPEFASEWDETRNGSMNNYLSGSQDNVWWICSRDLQHRWSTSINNRTKPEGTACPLCLNKSEDCTRKIFHELLGVEFVHARHPFLERLELDGYCESLSLAWEYQGVQHAQESPFFHRTPTAFQEQVERDERKVRLCAENLIHLITIPHTETFHDEPKLRRYIEEQIALWRALPNKRRRLE